MVSEKTKVVCPLGLHLRNSRMLAQAMLEFPCEVTLVFGEKSINAKSMTAIMAACIKQGHEIEFICDGEEEAQALKKAVSIIESGVGV